MRYVEAPTYYQPRAGDPPVVFVAGGISHVPNWRAGVLTALAGEDCVVLNPRRSLFDISDPDAAATQVAWECHHRRLDRLVMMMWLPASDPTRTVQPIALLELGAELARPRSADRHLIVGADPGYPRRLDVRLQVGCDRPDLVVHDTLDDTIAATITTIRLHQRAARPEEPQPLPPGSVG